MLFHFPMLIKGLFPKILVNDVRGLPIKIDNKEMQIKIANIVERIVKEKQSDPTAYTTALETEVGHLVYDLYGLSDEEIVVVEGASYKGRGGRINE